MICQKHHTNSTSIGLSNQNLILETHLNKVDFQVDGMTELAANIIAKLMYALCDVMGMRISG